MSVFQSSLKNNQFILNWQYSFYHEFFLSGNISIATHKNIEERIKASKNLLVAKGDDDQYEIFVDLMDNRACNEYAALPERLYVVLDGKIIFEGEPGPYGYKLDGVEKLLKKYSSKMN